MHDEFLHQLRKDPPADFAARLQTRLRQSMPSPRPQAPSRLRTLLTLLLLGGTAFAVTWIAMRGAPGPVAELYHHGGRTAAAGKTPSSTQTGGRDGFPQGLRWSTNGSSARTGAAPPGQPARSAVAATNPAPSSGTSAAAGSAASAGGALLGQMIRIRAVSSWSAYPYAAQFLQRISADGVNGGFPAHVDLSVRDSDSLLASVCQGGPSDPSLAYTFAPVGSVSKRPCPRSASAATSPVAAIPIDYEAVVLARSPLYGERDLTRREVYLAMAKWIPDPSRPGVVRRNLNTKWTGGEPIELLGPPLSSPTARSMIALLMQGGCDTYPWIAALKSTHPHQYARICRTVRTDGVYVEISGNAATRLLEEPNAIGILGYWDLMHSGRALAVSRLDGVKPTRQSIESGTYPASRELYLCFNRLRTNTTIMARLVGGSPMWQYPDWALVSLPLEQRFAALRDALKN
jgi:phosphate transport system substrate-binding protein